MSLEEDIAAARHQIESLTEQLQSAEVAMRRLEEALGRYNRCWHCHDGLEEEGPPRCGSCPEWQGCSEEGCQAPGCIEFP